MKLRNVDLDKTITARQAQDIAYAAIGWAGLTEDEEQDARAQFDYLLLEEIDR